MVQALALGADAVLLGRPVLWGLALGGQQGVQKVSSNQLCTDSMPLNFRVRWHVQMLPALASVAVNRNSGQPQYLTNVLRAMGSVSKNRVEKTFWFC